MKVDNNEFRCILVDFNVNLSGLLHILNRIEVDAL